MQLSREEAITQLSQALSAVTSFEFADQITEKALLATGLSDSPFITDENMDALLQAIGDEGGLVQELAELLRQQGL